MKPSTDTTEDKVTDPGARPSSEAQSKPALSANGDSKISELRRILVGSDEVSEILPEAVSKSSKKSTELSEATLPIVETNIRESVVRNPKVLADALFPVIGPAIRKAISAALSSMVQSFNQTLEHSVSPKGLGWRLEAFRTGRSFGEVVMLKTLRYSVEQVFLIHRETGLLLQHVARNPQDTEDADMVSAMLTAITDFAHDSFKTAEDATLDSFKISGLSVWIESGPDVIVAGAIRGNPPLELRETFSLAVEEIQYSFKKELELFEGDSDTFAASRPVLEKCLQFQAVEQSEKGFFSPMKLLAGILGLLVLLVVGYFALDYWRWSGLLETVRQEPGYVLTDYQRGWFAHEVSGLRDPLAAGDGELLSGNGYDEGDVSFAWRTFQDSDPKFVIERANKLLKPPAGVQFSVEGGVLTIDGKADAEWMSDATRFGPVISGVEEVKVKNRGLEERIASINNSKVLFECGSLNFVDEKGPQEVLSLIEEIAGFGNFDLEITGFADRTGSDDENEKISTRRAQLVSEAVKNRLLSKSLSTKIAVSEIGSKTEADECKVTFKVAPQMK